jgi:flagellar biosynthesis/type III secretory pathway chaperone
MTAILQRLIEALRNELQQYGEMLALLEQQHQAVKLQGPDDIWQSITAVNAHSALIQTARQTRQDLQRQLAEALGQKHDCSFTHLMPLLPESYRPLVTALVQENNELLWRARQRAQQNHLLLQQSVELMQRFLTTLSPEDQPAGLKGEEHSVLVEQTGPALYDALV